MKIRKKRKVGSYKNTPKELINIYQENNCNIRKVEKLLSVNRYYIYRLLFNGHEPTDKTKKGREYRLKLFLSETKHKKNIKPDFIVQWDHLPTEERHQVIKKYLNEKEKIK